MASDPLGILFSAGCITRFIEFGIALVCKGREIHIHNAIDDAAPLEFDIAKFRSELGDLNDELSRTARIDDVNNHVCLDQVVDRLNLGCRRVAKDMQIRLERLLHVAQGEIASMQQDSLKTVLEEAWDQDDINALAKRIQDFNTQLEHIVLPQLKKLVEEPTTGGLLESYESHENVKRLVSALRQGATSISAGTLALRSTSDSGVSREDIESTGHDHLPIHLTTLVDQIASDKGLLLQDFILEGLSYSSMRDREETVAEAHSNTFDWIFFPTSGDNLVKGLQSQGDTLLLWLKSQGCGNNMYWINGKAGSGKSTLMRFIRNHPATTLALRKWAGATPLVTASFYFWTSGSLEQRSQLGFLRYLLHQLLDQRKELIPLALPELWQRCWEAKTQDRIKMVLTWQIPELVKALRLFFLLTKQKTKVVLFIDGLDEFDGDQGRIVKLFQGIVEAGEEHVKVCVSSRPWAVFEAAFQSTPSLKLQDLTYQDMAQYVDDKFMEQPKLFQLSREHQDHYKLLVNELVNRANGVFLWINLTVRLLSEHMQSENTIEDLKNQLSLLPTDLDDLYRHILFNPHSFQNLIKRSQILQLLRARETVCNFTRNESASALTLWELTLAHEASQSEALETSISEAGKSHVAARCQKTTETLNVLFEGLLKTTVPSTAKSSIGLRFANEKVIDSAYNQANSHCTYVHRTVRDFLAQSPDWDFLLQQTANTPDFSPHKSHLRSCVLQLKKSFGKPERHRRLDERWPTIVAAITHARYASAEHEDKSNTREICDLLDQLNDTMNNLWAVRRMSTADDSWARNTFGSYELRNKHKTVFHDPFLSLVVKFGVQSYVLDRLQRGTAFLNGRGGLPILAFATEFLINGQRTVFPLSSPRLVSEILSYGADPNLIYQDIFGARAETPWKSALKSLRQAVRRGWIERYDIDDEGVLRWLKILKLFIEYGANVNVVVEAGPKDPAATAFEVVDAALERFGNWEVRDFRNLLSERKAC